MNLSVVDASPMQIQGSMEAALDKMEEYANLMTAADSAYRIVRRKTFAVFRAQGLSVSESDLRSKGDDEVAEARATSRRYESLYKVMQEKLNAIKLLVRLTHDVK